VAEHAPSPMRDQYLDFSLAESNTAANICSTRQAIQ
jgi:hypothetical protein